MSTSRMTPGGSGVTPERLSNWIVLFLTIACACFVLLDSYLMLAGLR